MILDLHLWELFTMQQNGMRPKEPHGLRTRYFSRYIKFDVIIPAGMLRRLKIYLSYRWKTLAWRGFVTLLALFPTVYGIQLGNMTIADKQRLSVLEDQGKEYGKLSLKVTSLEDILKKKDVEFGGLSIRVSALESEITIRKEVNEEDGKILERQAQEERDRQKRLQLEERNKARAEKLRRIGQTDDLRANPQAPATSIYSPVKN